MPLNTGEYDTAWLTEGTEDQPAEPAVADDWATEDVEDQLSNSSGPAKNDASSCAASGAASGPPVAVNESHQQHKRWSWREMIKRDGRLLIITLVIIVVMNIPYLKVSAVHPFCCLSRTVYSIYYIYIYMLSLSKPPLFYSIYTSISSTYFIHWTSSVLTSTNFATAFLPCWLGDASRRS